jgi:hypothetical protein
LGHRDAPRVSASQSARSRALRHRSPTAPGPNGKPPGPTGADTLPSPPLGGLDKPPAVVHVLANSASDEGASLEESPESAESELRVAQGPPRSRPRANWPGPLTHGLSLEINERPPSFGREGPHAQAGRLRQDYDGILPGRLEVRRPLILDPRPLPGAGRLAKVMPPGQACRFGR